MFNDQLSKNTRAFLSLCAQAGRNKRYVVKPYVRATKLSSDDSWYKLDDYYDVHHMEDLLVASNYAGLVNKEEYIRECPTEDPNHVSIHFIDNSETSKNSFRSMFRLKADYVSKTTANAQQHGWTECDFLNKFISRTPGRQYCVHSEVVREWEKIEEIIKENKCLNIYQWRGIDGVSHRLKFSEDDLKYSSIDLTYALRSGSSVENEVNAFAGKFLGDKYIAVYVRSEFMLRRGDMDYLQKCVNLVLQVLSAVKEHIKLSQEFVATDMGKFGSGWLVRYRKEKKLNENVFNDLIDYIIRESKGISFIPSSDSLDRGVIALTNMNLVSRARH
ncbi:uncharacterized protein LOC124458258 [Xenia sp. Carnegie-2017]|uniref:uncharacterized protein LOC124458258 n=1 Tax=Xenia sp. Carnegie-2017 TaxID=2897299 RepID=UPI001F03D83E|nr:uncharacterized protein LOC124458258 [Xenia sp. Carnegie-2017]